MKIDFDKKLLKYLTYISVTIIVLYISFFIISNMGNIIGTMTSIISYVISLVKPFLIAIIIAYLLYPISKFIENFLKNNRFLKIKSSSKRRLIGILISYLCVFTILGGIIRGIYVMIGGQISRSTTIDFIMTDINNYFANNNFSIDSIQNSIDNLNSPIFTSLKPYILNAASSVYEYFANNISKFTTSIFSLGSNIVTFFIAFIISIYLLKDREYFLSIWNRLYSLIFKDSKVGKNITNTFSIINVVFGKFIKGQLLEAFIVGILSAIVLSIVKIQYGVVIGIIAGICNMIPYVGPIVGTILAAIMGLLSGSPIKILYAIIGMVVVQQIDNHLLAPNIVGNSVGLHPVFTMMAILIGGNLFGVIGMLISVPLAASLKILFSNWYYSKIKS